MLLRGLVASVPALPRGLGPQAAQASTTGGLRELLSGLGVVDGKVCLQGTLNRAF